MRRLTAKLALSPTALVVAVVYIGCMAWTVGMSFTDSRALPSWNFIGLDQYVRLYWNSRWRTSLANMFLFGGGYVGGCLLLGYLLAVLVDQKVRLEKLFRTVFLYPYALSYIITGIAWQWLLNPTLGLQAFVRGLGWSGFAFAWMNDQDLAIWTVVIAAVWHGSGVVMALLLSGLRGVDEDIWKATRVDGVPAWRVYVRIIPPILTPAIATSFVLLAAGVVKNYDLIVAMTGGGPGVATEVPAKFVMENLLERANVGLATAGATIMLTTVLAIAAPLLYWRARRRRVQ
jgi:glucose/mannose transport system permease protein